MTHSWLWAFKTMLWAFGADEHGKIIDFVLSTFVTSLYNVISVVGDDTSKNKIMTL